MHYYQFNIGDYVSHTRHLTVIEDCAYRRLLDAYYLSEKPLVGDSKAIARQIGMRDYEQEVDDILKEFFQPCDEGWRNVRADREIEIYKGFSEAGKRGAAKRWSKGGDSPPIATPYTPPIATNNHKPITNNHNSVPKGTEAKPQLTTDEIIFGYGVPLLTNAGTPEKQARTFLGGIRKTHGDSALVDALRECIRAKPLQPLEWLAKALPPRGAPPSKMNKQEALEASNQAVVDRWLSKQGLEDEAR